MGTPRQGAAVTRGDGGRQPYGLPRGPTPVGPRSVPFLCAHVTSQVGWALAQLPVGPMVLVSTEAPPTRGRGVSVDHARYVDAFGVRFSSAGLVWHSRVDGDFARRTRAVQRWVETEGAACADQPVGVKCDAPVVPPREEQRSCGGQRVLHCHMTVPATRAINSSAMPCSAHVVDLWSFTNDVERERRRQAEREKVAFVREISDLG